MNCIDDNTAVEFLEGALRPSRARAVEEHAAGCAACRRLLAEVARSPALDTDPTPAALPPGPEPGDSAVDLAKGESVGRFLILSRLGAGGMGVVFAAYDPNLDRKVALKVLRGGGTTGLPAKEAQTRLLREAQAIAQLAHPNVVAVYDVGTHRSGVYIAMELVEGETLTHWLRRWDRPWREVLDRFIQAGRGLQHAHAGGLVHRDFKPDNVLVGADERVRVMDFGLARSLFTSSGRLDAVAAGGLPAEVVTAINRTLTRTGAVVGTPRYMAPEQFLGRDTDARSDQFGFCVALYEALYGQHPFPGETALDVSGVHGLGGGPLAVLPPPAHSSVPAWLHRVILRGLERDPLKRYPSMAALLDDAVSGARPAASHRRSWLALGLGAVMAAGVAGAIELRRGGAAGAAPPGEDVTVVPNDAFDEIQRELVALRNQTETLRLQLEAARTRESESQSHIGALESTLQAKEERILELEQRSGPSAVRGPRAVTGRPIARALGPPLNLTPLTTDAAQSGLAHAMTDIRDCFDEWFDRRGTAGVLVVDVAVAPNGRVHSISPRGIGDSVLKECVTGAVQRSRFEIGDGLTRLRVVFQLGAAQELSAGVRVLGVEPPPPAHPGPELPAAEAAAPG